MAAQRSSASFVGAVLFSFSVGGAIAERPFYPYLPAHVLSYIYGGGAMKSCHPVGCTLGGAIRNVPRVIHLGGCFGFDEKYHRGGTFYGVC